MKNNLHSQRYSQPSQQRLTMTMGQALLAAATLLAATAMPTALAAVAEHLIAALPNQSVAMLSNHYSGYLEIDTGLFVHYYLVESESDPKDDPLVFWTNGVSTS